MKHIYFIFLSFVLIGCSAEQMTSPDGKVKAGISVQDGMLGYDLTFNDAKVIDFSPLGIIINGDSLGQNASCKLLKQETINEAYTTRGFHTSAINHAKQYTYEISSQNTVFRLEARMYDDGFAFRYIIPGEDTRLINKELTTFRVPKNTPVWFFERPNHWKLKTYAGEWLRTVSDSLAHISPTGPVQGSVLVYELPGNSYMAITEAALYDYSGMRLEAQPDASLLANFTEEEGFHIDGEIVTPWRVVLLADDLNELVNTDMITSLNPAPDEKLFADQSWIKPGKCVWSWWTENESYMTIPYEKYFVDMAEELKFEYTLIDAGWENVWDSKWERLKELCDYAKEKGVGVFVWKHSDELNFPENKYEKMALFLDSVKQAGAVGVKIDYMNGESKSLIDFDIQALTLCAERKLMLNFHGCQKPSGEFRRFPNEVTREGIRGLELNKMKQHIPGNHNVALVFTRCILNNSDYTPVGFTNPGNTTWTHQLATAYAFTSPMLALAEHPDTLLHNEKIRPVLPLFRTLPTVWDETIVLPESSIAETAVLARRSGDTWYLIVLNGNKPKQLSIKTDFLTEGKWSAFEVRDDLADQYNRIINQSDIKNNDILNISLSTDGGYVGCFKLIN